MRLLAGRLRQELPHAHGATLVKRGCRLIIVADATADPVANRWNTISTKKQSRTFEDFRDTESKVLTDFGVSIQMDWDNFNPDGPDPALIIPGKIERLPIERVFQSKERAGSVPDAPACVRAIAVRA